MLLKVTQYLSETDTKNTEPNNIAVLSVKSEAMNMSHRLGKHANKNANKTRK